MVSSFYGQYFLLMKIEGVNESTSKVSGLKQFLEVKPQLAE